ncbi:MAG: FAD-dependent oxidoreductase, partial [Acidimicrobiia bacterium]|nr:FAD-dependent oxidoreductase [Acidimicrobiia bacterium]
MSDFDAVVVGAGPNGLSAAATLARTGRKVLVIEGSDTIGGGTRTEELTLPGFLHDVCSAFHPLAMGSPFLSGLPLAEHGLEWIQPDVPLGHAIAPGRSAILERDVAATAAGLGLDGATYHR